MRIKPNLFASSSFLSIAPKVVLLLLVMTAALAVAADQVTNPCNLSDEDFAGLNGDVSI